MHNFGAGSCIAQSALCTTHNWNCARRAIRIVHDARLEFCARSTIVAWQCGNLRGRTIGIMRNPQWVRGGQWVKWPERYLKLDDASSVLGKCLGLAMILKSNGSLDDTFMQWTIFTISDQSYSYQHMGILGIMIMLNDWEVDDASSRSALGPAIPDICQKHQVWVSIRSSHDMYFLHTVDLSSNSWQYSMRCPKPFVTKSL